MGILANVSISIPDDVREEINKPVGVEGAMGGNITVTSNSSFGSGVISFVFPGRFSNSIFHFLAPFLKVTLWFR